MTPRRALVSSYTVPRPDQDRGSKRLDDLISLLSEAGWQITFATTTPLVNDSYLRALQRRGVLVVHGTVDTVEQILGSAPMQLALLAFWPTAELYLPVIRRVSPETRVIVDSVDLHLLRHARRIFGSGDDGGALLDARFGDQVVGELNVYAAADAVLTVSDKEAALIHDLTGESGLAHPVPDWEELPVLPRPFDERHGLLFVGSFRHAPNVDAVAYLCRSIIPRLPEALVSEHPIYIVGAGLDDRVRLLASGSPGVRLVGWVPSLVPYFERTRVSVLPLLAGAGTKGKLIQALMLGSPVVATSIAAEGFDVEHERDLMIADDAEAFSSAIIRVTTDETLWKTLSANGRARIMVKHARANAERAMDAVVERVFSRPAKGALLEACGHEQHHQRLVYQYEQGLLASGRTRSPSTAATATVPEGGDASSRSARDPLSVEATADSTEGPPHAEDPVRLIAFYLPQFHPIPENDAWWGEGFTEWTNVRKAVPLFPGHDQPRRPSDLGYYDLRSAETRQAQAELAARHGIHGFCYYHYWFGGKRLLEQPFDAVLASGAPDLPFSLCWANEPWSRRWDGSEHQILQPQTYSAEDDREHLRSLLPAFADRRAIKVDGKLLFLVYQARVLPEAARTVELWRTEVHRAGLPGLHLLAVETGWDEGWDATEVGFDGKVLFQPQFTWLFQTSRIPVPEHERLRVYDYQQASASLGDPPPVDYPRYDTVFPSWDNTARRGTDGVVVHGSTPEAYERWLTRAIERARMHPPGHRLVFINAWNEWAEGAYLEPDHVHGRGYLEATQRPVVAARMGPHAMA